ncbi:hypothetical protein ACOSQ3_004776 [Xanthoceras sorbifolium]
MKTRELPNLSECQGCRYRIDCCTAGKTSIQILYSEWRIVLLCQKCLSLVESSQICSYCFKQITQEDFFRCCQCKRCIHTNCFSMYKSIAPLSQFSFCVDCWVPKSIIRKRPFFRARKSSNNIPSNSALSLEANCDGDGDHNTSRNKVIVDDAQLAFQLHRVMNSSSRISKNFSAVNSSCSSVSKRKELNDNENVVVPFKEGEGSCSDKLVKSSGDENSMNLDSISCQNNPYQSSTFNVEIDNGKLDRYLLKYRKRNSNNESKTLHEKFPCQSEIFAARFLFKYRKRKLSAKGTSNVKTKTFYERFPCQSETLAARYLLKYRKRKTSSKEAPNDNSEALSQRLPCQILCFTSSSIYFCKLFIPRQNLEGPDDVTLLQPYSTTERI